jgi:hypothetical protein
VLTWDLRGGRAAAVLFGAGGPSGHALLQRLPLRPLLASLPSLAQQVPPAWVSLVSHCHELGSMNCHSSCHPMQLPHCTPAWYLA